MVKGILNRTVNVLSESYKSIEERDEEKLLSGSIMIELKRSLWESDKPFMPDTWDEFGFKIFSQSNEDGLIQYLIRKIDIPNKVFIEFGCSNYRECNTRFLLMHDYWDGFVMDGSEDNIKSIVDSSIYWKHNLTAVSAFITKENINELLMKSGFLEDIGILSIDIDGNDYWVWNEIDCINPRIIICEYNPIFGSKCCVSVPYKEDFYRTEAHYSNLYWGASLGAYVHLAKKKGYRLVCINQMAHNAFFVRNDVGLCLEEVSVDQAYRTPKYRESRNENGELTYLGQKEGIELIKEMPVVDVLSGQERTIKECLMSVSKILKEFFNKVWWKLYGYWERWYIKNEEEYKRTGIWRNKKTDRTFYVIRRRGDSAGLFSYVLIILEKLAYCDERNYVPVIDMQHTRNTYLNKMEVGFVNSWEYYFKQPAGYGLKSISKCKNVIFSDLHIKCLVGSKCFRDRAELLKWSDLYRKYIVLNEKTEEHIRTVRKQLFSKSDKVLGVLCRGTDYNNHPPKHPIQPEPNQVMEDAQRVLTGGGV